MDASPVLLASNFSWILTTIRCGGKRAKAYLKSDRENVIGTVKPES